MHAAAQPEPSFIDPVMCQGQSNPEAACSARCSDLTVASRVNPFPTDGQDPGHDHWSEKQADEAERLQAPKDADQSPQEWQARSTPDQTRLNDVVAHQHHGSSKPE